MSTGLNHSQANTRRWPTIGPASQTVDTRLLGQPQGQQKFVMLYTTQQTRDWPNAGLMLDQRRRRCANIKPAMGQRPVLAG